MRYSLLPDQIDALWGIQLDPQAAADTHVRYVAQRGDARAAFSSLWSMLWH
ncbi:MAG: hypothetical protein R3E95_01545 [Thiolinea sp.]